jgi:hypothetical protein
MTRSAGRLVGLAVALAAVTGHVAVGQEPRRPLYLPYAAFAPDDTGSHLSAKQAYNDAVERYNKALYDYHVTLGRHDQLVEVHRRAGTPAEQEKARAAATPLRARLETLSRDVTSLAAAVDQARRRAAQAGVTLTP